MLDLSDLANDPDLGDCLTITRTTGKFAQGGWQGTATTFPAFGVVTIADDEALAQVPEGDRVTGSLLLMIGQPVYETLANQGGSGNAGISDKITWQGEFYRVQKVQPWKQHGFWAAILSRMSGK